MPIDLHHLFPGDGEMSALCRRFDWSSTSLGPVEEWPASLRTMVSTVLASGHPMVVGWGPDLIMIYNDAFRPSLGEGGRHPRGLAAPAREFWTDVWEVIGPQVEQVLAGGDATWHEDQYVPIERNGSLQDAWWTYSFSPLQGDGGEVQGVLTLAQEVTARVRAEAGTRRLASRLERVLESITDAFFAVDRDWRFTFVNREAGRVLEREREELVGRVLWNEFPHAVGSIFEDRYRQAMTGGSAVHFEAFFPPLDRWFSVHAYPSDEGLAVYFQDINERRAAEESLRSSERRFRALAESMPLIVWTANPDGTVDYQTEAVLEFTGRTREELVGAGWLEVLHPDDREPSVAVWTRAVETGEPYQVEFRIRGRDGAHRWFLTRAVPIRDEAGAILKWYGSSTDIHDRRQMEARLRESEERFRTVARATSDAIWDWDLTADTVWWSDGIQETFGIPRRSLPAGSSGWSERIHPDDAAGVLESIHEVLEGESGGWHATYRFRRGDGRYARVEDRGFVIRDEEGTPIRMVGGMSDRTGEIESRIRLQEQAELLDRARDAILVRRLDHTIEYWNAGAERIYGWTREETVGSSTEALLYRDPTAFLEATARVLADEAWQGELEQTRKDGSVISVEASWSLVRDREGRPSRILAINTDITERKKLQAQFLRAQRLESIGTLAGGIAHDLNNVLAPILMSIGLLKLGEEDPDRLESLETIENSSRRGADMVKQVLAFARGVEGARVTVEPGRIIRELERILRDTFPRNITVHGEIAPELWTISGDPTQVQQVLMNLFVNARDAMPDGGRLTVTAENVQVDTQYASMSAAAEPGDYVRISVADTGTGMPPDVLDRVFDPFFTTKGVGEGTGLGLSTVQAIVQSHGGFVHVYSEAGSGATFRVYFPASGSAEDGVDPGEPRKARRGRGELVLVVDDEAAVRTITQQTLEAFGYRVLTAADGAEAVALYASRGTEIALVLTDIMMPIMDGPATIRALIRLDPGVRIVAASGLGANGGVARAASSGVKHFLPKPYTAETLLEVVHQVLHRDEPG